MCTLLACWPSFVQHIAATTMHRLTTTMSLSCTLLDLSRQYHLTLQYSVSPTWKVELVRCHDCSQSCANDGEMGSGGVRGTWVWHGSQDSM